MNMIDDLIGQAETAFENAEYDEVKQLCLEGIKQLEKSSDGDSVKATIKFLNILSDADSAQGRLFDSMIRLNRIITLAEELRDPYLKAEAIIKIGDKLAKSGKWKEARAKFEEVEKIVEKFENTSLLGYTLVGLGEIEFRTGKNMDAITTGQKVVEIGEKVDNQHLIGRASNIIANGWYGMGKFEESLEANSKTIEAYRNNNEDSNLAMALNNRGEIYKTMGDYDKALENYKEGLGTLGKKVANRELSYFYPNIAECHIRLNQGPEAKEIIEKAEKVMKGSEDKYAVACLWMVKGMSENLDEHEDEALNWLSKAEKRMASLNAQFDTGIIALEHALTLIKYGHEYDGKMKLESALAYFEESNSKHMIEKTKSLIEKSG